MSNLITPHIIHDLPIAREKDGDPQFSFDAYANTFARLIADRKTRTPIVIGVSGKWGSGKTTLLKTIQAKLDETSHRLEEARYSFLGSDSEGDFRRCRTVWFNAWKYSDEDELLVALVRVIVQEMSRDGIVEQFLAKINDPAYPRRDVANTVLSWFGIKTPLGDLKLNTGTPVETPFAKKTAMLDLFSDTFDRLLAVWVHQSRNIAEMDIPNLIKQKIDPDKGVMVVFIDDLDRCLPEKAIQVLEAIKLFLDREGVAFVLAADEDAIRAAIEAHHERSKIKDQRADDYLEKIFQVRFRLPPLSDTQAKNYLADALDIVDPSIKENVKLIVAGAETNPRQIKTFVNYLETGWAVLKNSNQAENVEKTDFLYWLALTRVGMSFCDKLRELPKDVRLNFLNDAIKWANDPTYKTGEYDTWSGGAHRRLRDVLKVVNFSDKVNANVLEGFIFWNVQLGEELKAQTSAVQISEVFKTSEILTTRGEAPSDYWIEIPAGKFVMGSDKGQDNERPQQTIEIPYAYKIARYPVTNADFVKFVNATKCKTTAEEEGKAWVISRREEVKGANWAHPSGPESTVDQIQDHPVVQVSWRDAIAYCEWLQDLRVLKELGDLKVRLPTEAEWEKAARGEYGKEYPWGDEFDASKCNTSESDIGTTTPAGKFSPQGDSPYGVADMSGNVWEWCQSKYNPYPYKANDGREELKDDAARVLRGGSFVNLQRVARGACRYHAHPFNRNDDFGFRVVVSPSSRI